MQPPVCGACRRPTCVRVQARREAADAEAAAGGEAETKGDDLEDEVATVGLKPGEESRPNHRDEVHMEACVGTLLGFVRRRLTHTHVCRACPCLCCSAINAERCLSSIISMLAVAPHLRVYNHDFDLMHSVRAMFVSELRHTIRLGAAGGKKVRRLSSNSTRSSMARGLFADMDSAL